MPNSPLEQVREAETPVELVLTPPLEQDKDVAVKSKSPTSPLEQDKELMLYPSHCFLLGQESEPRA